jgi:hypothetical protein
VINLNSREYLLSCFWRIQLIVPILIIGLWYLKVVHTLKTVKRLLHLVPTRTSRSSGYDVYAHVVYVVICYMSITCICLLYVVICYMSVIYYLSVICPVLGTSSYMYMSVICCSSSLAFYWHSKKGSGPPLWPSRLTKGRTYHPCSVFYRYVSRQAVRNDLSLNTRVILSVFSTDNLINDIL